MHEHFYAVFTGKLKILTFEIKVFFLFCFDKQFQQFSLECDVQSIMRFERLGVFE